MSGKKLSPGDRKALIERLRIVVAGIDTTITALYATGQARSSLSTTGSAPDKLNTDLAAALALADKTTEKFIAVIEGLEKEGDT